jgi:hypothetical protein
MAPPSWRVLLSAATPVSVRVSTVVVKVGHRERARRCILDPDGDGEDSDERIAIPTRYRTAAEHCEDHRACEECGLHGGGGGQQVAAVLRKPYSHPPPDQRHDSERRHGHHRCGNREARRSHQREAQQHDVAGHVGDEDMPKKLAMGGVVDALPYGPLHIHVDLDVLDPRMLSGLRFPARDGADHGA